MLDLDLVRTFVAIVDSGGFTRAAERVNRTQSTVSQQIGKLETSLGKKLLMRERAGTTILLTEAGEVLLGYARRLLALSDEAQDALRQPGAPTTVRLGLPQDFAGRRLTDLLSGFAQASPRIRLDTVSGLSIDLRRLLESGEIDLALIKRDRNDGPCLARWAERLVWVAGSGADITLDPLPLALFPQGCIYRARAIDALEGQGRRWRIAFASPGLSGVQAAVASGLGMSILPEEAVLAEHRRLGPEDGFGALPPSELALVARAARLDGAARSLAEYLERHIEGPARSRARG